MEPRGRVVELTKKGLDGWDERFDHLGKHFIEEDLKIAKYAFPDDDDMYGPTQSSSDDEEDDEEQTGDGKLGEREDVLEDLCDNTGANGGKRVLISSAPDGEKHGVELANDVLRGGRTVEPQKPPNSRANSNPTANLWWYCVCSLTPILSDHFPYSANSRAHAV